jgi:hypothetical protein
MRQHVFAYYIGRRFRYRTAGWSIKEERLTEAPFSNFKFEKVAVLVK